jgi:antitoxin CptB
MSRRGKLAWRCRRGIRELDLLLERFLENHYDELSQVQLEAFEKLLAGSNDELSAWLLGTNDPPQEDLAPLVQAIRRSRQSYR